LGKRRSISRAALVGLTIIAGIGLVLPLPAQAPEAFKTRLAPVAIEAAMKNNIAGVGQVTATLAGSKFTLNGTFEGLKSPATVAHIHQGIATGVRGAPVLDLTITKADHGTLTGSFDLKPEQIEKLRQGKWYVQVHSEKAPEGNLWGWLLK
jgi:hypothetical protein